MKSGPPSQIKLTSTRSYLLSPALRTNGLRLVFVMVVAWGEMGIFFWSISTCKWPEVSSTAEDPSHVLILSDTQVQDTHFSLQWSHLSHAASRFILDSNLKKSWLVASQFSPDAIIFLGDMLGTGKYSRTEEEFQRIANKFKAIFTPQSPTPVHYIPGNDDVGMGMFTPLSSNIRDYYSSAFGTLSPIFNIKNHSFFGLDAPGLIDKDYKRSGNRIDFQSWDASPEGPRSFLEHAVNASRPLVLLSHIPLSRPDNAPCGPFREKGTLKRGVGFGRQNTLGKHTTNYIIRELQPVAIFSGDNHDYCEYTHTVAADTPGAFLEQIPEVTVKSFSVSSNVRRPGFELVSVVEPSSVSSPDQKSIQHSLCLLPNQHGIYYGMYLPAISVILFFLLRYNMLKAQHTFKHRKVTPLPSYSLSRHSSSISIPQDMIHRSPRSASAVSTRFPSPSGSPLNSPLLPRSPIQTSFATNGDAEYSDGAFGKSGYVTQFGSNFLDYGRDAESFIYQEPEELDFPQHVLPALDRDTKRRSISWSFSFRGQRRALRILGPYAQFLENTAFFQEGVLQATIKHWFSVLWPGIIAWFAINLFAI